MNTFIKVFVSIAMWFFVFSQGLADNMITTTVMIKFLPKNVTIWILDSQEKDILYPDVSSERPNTSKFMNTLVLKFSNDFHIKIKNSDIRSEKKCCLCKQYPDE
jgi:hypothetical protein